MNICRNKEKNLLQILIAVVNRISKPTLHLKDPQHDQAEDYTWYEVDVSGTKPTARAWHSAVLSTLGNMWVAWRDQAKPYGLASIIANIMVPYS